MDEPIPLTIALIHELLPKECWGNITIENDEIYFFNGKEVKYIHEIQNLINEQ